MKIEEMRDAYYEATEAASALVRQLNLAGIAVVWLFKVGANSAGISWSPVLLWPLALFILSLSCDLLQYIYKALIWGVLTAFYYRKFKSNDHNVVISGKWNWISLLFFWAKTIFLMIAYVLLLQFLWHHLAK